MKWFLGTAMFILFAACPSVAVAGDTICADTFITGIHDNVIVPPGTICDSSAHVLGSVKVFGGYRAHPGTIIEGNVDGEPGLFVRLLGLDVVVRGNVQLKRSSQTAESSGYLAGTEIGGNFQWEENSNLLFAQGGTIGGDFIVVKSNGGGEIFGNIIRGNLQCSENEPTPVGGGNIVGGNKEQQCAAF